MKSLLTSIILLHFGLSFAHADLSGCSAETKNKTAFAKHPDALIGRDQLTLFTKQYIKDHPSKQGSRSAPYVIPVVFHILHDGGRELLSDSLIRAEVSHMNEYMSATNPGISTIVPAFDTLIGDAQIEFRLAQKDPQGVCTNGIDRIYTRATNVGNNYTRLHVWPRDKYLNIWLYKGLDEDTTFYGTLAYAYYPSAVATKPLLDGIVSKYFNAGAYDIYTRTAISHEAGHWLNLLHPIAPCSDLINDEVDDTPPMSSNAGCNLTQSLCNPAVIENVQNIMGGGSCPLMFTKGQVSRMHATLNSSISSRSSLWQAANLTATGTDVAAPVSCALPIADFTASMRYACTGQNILFQDASYNADVTGRTWTFPNDAAFSSLTSASPVVSFTDGGWKTIELRVSNANGSNTKTKSIIYVSDGSVMSAPFFDGFENAAGAQSRWQSINYDNNTTSFQYQTGVGHHSNACFKLNDFNATYQSDVDELLSPTFDMHDIDTSLATLSFDYSFASADASHENDSSTRLTVLATADCGLTWGSIYTQRDFALINGSVTASSYTPGQTDEYWQNISVQIPAAYRTAAVNFKIQVVSGTGINNFYLDNINLGQDIENGIAENSLTENMLSIIPNPATESTVIRINATTGRKVDVDLFDIRGKKMGGIFSGILKTGNTDIPYVTSGLSSGMYMIRISDGLSTAQKKMIKL